MSSLYRFGTGIMFSPQASPPSSRQARLSAVSQTAVPSTFCNQHPYSDQGLSLQHKGASVSVGGLCLLDSLVPHPPGYAPFCPRLSTNSNFYLNHILAQSLRRCSPVTYMRNHGSSLVSKTRYSRPHEKAKTRNLLRKLSQPFLPIGITSCYSSTIPSPAEQQRPLWQQLWQLRTRKGIGRLNLHA